MRIICTTNRVMNMKLTVEYLREAIYYDEATGCFIWRIRPEHHFSRSNQHKNWNGRYAGTIAGKIDNNGYLNIKVNYHLYRAHRLAWFYVHGVWPDCVDHEDGNRLNNAIKNLRDTNHTGNNQNSAKRSDNKSGITGVYWDKEHNKWRSSIMADKQKINLGRYSDFFEACCARKSAEREYGFHMNHGRANS